MDDFWSKVKMWMSAHKWAVIFGIVGVMYVLLWFEIGFWRTILLTLAAAVCIFIGSLVDSKVRHRDDD